MNLRIKPKSSINGTFAGYPCSEQAETKWLVHDKLQFGNINNYVS